LTDDLLTHINWAEISIGQRRIAGIKRTYAQAAPGDLIALVGSSGHVEISVVNGNAAQSLGLGPDSPLALRTRQEA
jgi:S-adenosylmethionine hydrolase